MSAATHRTPGKFPEDYLLHSEHGGSLKTIIYPKSYFLWTNDKREIDTNIILPLFLVIGYNL
jgi:hypothetical protein